MAIDIKSFLEGAGLSDKEADLYICSLKCGAQTASVLANKTGIARSTVSFVFGELIKKGFATKETRENGTYFSAVEPELLESILIQRQAEAKKRLNDFHDLLPFLSNLQGSGQLLPKVKYYQGIDSLLRTIDGCCAKDEAVWFISSHSNMHPKIREYIESVYIPKSRGHVHKNKMIISDLPVSRGYVARAKGVYDEVIFVNPAQNPFKLTVAIHGSSVDFISYDPSDLSGVVIKNQLIADHMRVIFEMMKRGR